MSSYRLVFAFGAALATSAAILPLAYASDAPQAQQGGMRGFLSPQQRAMLMLENRGQWQSMTEDQRHTARDKMRAEWIAMTPADREKRRDELQAKWDALPQGQKDALTARMQQWAAHRDQTGAQ